MQARAELEMLVSTYLAQVDAESASTDGSEEPGSSDASPENSGGLLIPAVPVVPVVDDLFPGRTTGWSFPATCSRAWRGCSPSPF